MHQIKPHNTMKIKVSFFLFFITLFSFGQNGTVNGTISDKDLNGEPLPFANVVVKGTTIGATTDINGKYALEIKEGNHILVISFLGYESKEIPFSIKAGETKTINETIGSGSVSLQDVVVKKTVSREKETALLLEQKKAVEIKQSIGAQEMSRKGVSDVEEGLTKISGITKVDSRGIFVRGLEDRYNNLLINDLAAPTNNPFKKIIPLDLFPTDIVSVIDVFKTFNPNIYGDFAGGTFNISTPKSNKEITKLSLGTGFTSNSSLSDFLISPEADNTKGFFGFNGKERELPANLQGKKPTSYTFTTPESQKYFASGFDVNSIKSPLNSNIGFLHSKKFDFSNDRKFSYLLSFNFDNDYFIKKGIERTLSNFNTGYEFLNNFISTEYLYKTSLTSLLGLGYNSKRIKLYSNTFLIKTTENSIKDQFGSPQKGFDNQILRTNQLTKTDYLNTQLSGEYAITEDKNHTIKAATSYAKTGYTQPDRKSFGGNFNAATNEINLPYGGNNFLRQYLNIDSDFYFSHMAEYNWKFGQKEEKNRLTIGYNGINSAMQSSYRFIASQSLFPIFINSNINTIDTQINNDLNNGLFFFRESSNATYKVKLAEMTNAGYTNFLFHLGTKWEINGGIRAENATKEIKFRGLGSPNNPYKTSKKDNFYILPSLNVKYSATEKTNIRFAASKTYTKPVIMEAFPLSYINADGTSIQGNAILVNSDNYNADIKLEIFPSEKELFAFGVFGKYLKNPIEKAFISNATTSTITTFLNSESAYVYGAEAEFIVDLGRINKSLDNFSLGFNTTLMNSKVNINPKYKTQDEDGNITETASIETHATRKLQGASNFIMNADLKYQFDINEKWTNTMTLVYNVYSKRIYAIGTNGQDHTYELPFNQLDFVWGSKVSDHIDLKLSVDNILNPLKRLEFGNEGKQKIVEDSFTYKDYKKGTGISLKLNYTF